MPAVNEIERLRRIRLQFQTERDDILQAPRLSQEAKAGDVAEVKADAAERAYTVATRLWGTLEDGTLEGGMLWSELAAARERLRAAQDAADDLDHAKLANYLQRVPAVLGRYSEEPRFWSFYEHADTYTRRALQFQAHTVADKFDVLAASRLQRDLDAELRTPDVIEAEESLDAVAQLFFEAVEVSQRAANEFDSAAAEFMGPNGRIARLLAHVNGPKRHLTAETAAARRRARASWHKVAVSASTADVSEFLESVEVPA